MLADDQRIRQFLEAASRERASGRMSEAERLLRQAQAESPRHPLVLNEMAATRQRAGDPAGALGLIEQSIKTDPTNPTSWLHKAAILRKLGRDGDAATALEQALAIQPRNLHGLLHMAQLHRAKGDVRTASATYRMALQSIPANTELPPEMRPLIQEARATIDAGNQALETFLESRLKTMRDRLGNERLDRFDKAMQTLLLKRPVYRPQPSFLYFPHLPAIEFYDRADFPWLASLEAATPDIRAELLEVMAEGSAALEPYITLPGTVADKWRDLNHSKRWGAYFFWREGMAFPDHLARCPLTAKALEAWPPCELPGCAPTAMFSILEPRTRIPPHIGVNNCRLVVHIPLVIPQGCGFRVGPETREWKLGEAFVFDDTIDHEAWNNSDDWRAVLIVDIWNPHLSLAERDMVSALIAGVADFYGDLPPYVAPAQKPN
jgi:aspartyl/asparaginyl beta-hydroxylase (cupin superfamily)/Tfp pilus assembly protein PilF